MKTFPDDLIAGYRAFKQRKFAHESERYNRLAEEGQQPNCMICSGSDLI